MKSNKSGDINGQPLAQRLRVTIIQPPQPRRPFPPFGLIFQAVIMRLGVNSQTPYITLPCHWPIQCILSSHWSMAQDSSVSFVHIYWVSFKTRLSQVADFMPKYFYFMAAAASHFVIVDKKICISCLMRTPGLRLKLIKYKVRGHRLVCLAPNMLICISFEMVTLRATGG